MSVVGERVARWAGLGVVAAIPLVLGGIYSMHHTDSHHWGFVLGTALDFMAGRELFTEVFLQYGAGSPLLFRLLSLFSIPITLTTIGYVVTLFYVAGLVLLFLCLERLHSTTLAWGTTLLVVLFHPWPVYPWADYFAGTCLLLACYLLLRGDRWREPVAWGGAAAALFLAFLFRNTYLLSFLAAGVVYGGMALAVPKLRDRRILRMLVLLGGGIALYLSLLAWQGKLGLAYLQTTGQSGEVYGLNEGRTWFLLRQLLLPKEVPFLLFSLLALLNVALIFQLCWRRGVWFEQAARPGLILWFALLGGAGFSQSLHLYELFRLQSACSPLFLGAAALLAGWLPWAESTRRLVLGYVLLPILLFFAAVRFPDLLVKPSPTMLWPVMERPDEAVRSTEAGGREIPILAGHRFHPEVWRFYQEMADQLCDGKSRIVNLTFDPVLPYLCPGQVNVSSIPFHSPEHLRRLATTESTRILAGRFREGEVIVSQLTAQMRNHPELEQVATVVRPGRIRWMPVEPLGVFRRRAGAQFEKVP